MKILVSGAGIGGLTAALACAQRGEQVCVFEQADTRSEAGAGIQLSPNAMQVLDALGLATAVVARGFEPEAAAMRHHRTGRPYFHTPMGDTYKARYGAPYMHIHRADLIDVLHQGVRQAGVELHLGTPVIGYRQDATQIELQMSNGASTSGDVAIGADGIHSSIRTTMLGAEQPRFTGQVAWRGLVPADRLPPDVIAPDANVWVGPGRHFVAYYLRGGELINFVAVEERDQWADEAKESWQVKGRMRDVRAAFDGWDPAIGTLLAACEACFLWGLFDRAPLPRWTDGRAALLGDACHPMLPFMAQGGAMAIEDSFVLARELATDAPIVQALRIYENLRKPRASQMQMISRVNAKMFHADGVLTPVKRFLQFGLINLIPALAGLAQSRLDAIYGVNVMGDAC